MAILHYLRVLCVKLGIACPRCLAVLNYHIVQTYAYADTHHRECNSSSRISFADKMPFPRLISRGPIEAADTHHRECNGCGRPSPGWFA